jgi:hypothetical protein
VENFHRDKFIVIRTRRSNVYSKLKKLNYNLLLSTLLLNSTFGKKKQYFYYSSIINNDLVKHSWLFYANVIPKNSGLVTSNHTKSILYTFLKNSNRSNLAHTTSFRNLSYHNFEAYQIFMKKNLFKKIIIHYMSVFAQSHILYSSNFDIYTGYVWLNWHLKFNPVNNIFYLKVYNY